MAAPEATLQLNARTAAAGQDPCELSVPAPRFAEKELPPEWSQIRQSVDQSPSPSHEPPSSGERPTQHPEPCKTDTGQSLGAEHQGLVAQPVVGEAADSPRAHVVPVPVYPDVPPEHQFNIVSSSDDDSDSDTGGC